MGFRSRLSITLVALSLFTSCASMNSSQKHDLKSWQAQKVDVEEKKPGLAAALNVLPGVGDFYNGNVGLGVLNLLLWPASVFWAPVGGATGAQEVNYYATKAYVEELEKKKKLLKNELEVAFVAKQIHRNDYYFANKKIDSMELREFEKKIELVDLLPNSSLHFERIPTSLKQ